MAIAQNQIEELRAEYSKIDLVDPGSPIYQNLITALDLLDSPKLEMLAGAQIKWVSMLACNRLARRAMGIK